MTTIVQIRRLMKPLLARQPDLALVHRGVVLRPIDHVLAGVKIDSTWAANRLRLRWTVTHFCQPIRFLGDDWGEIIWPKNNNGWFWDDPAMAIALYDQIESEILPILRRLLWFNEYVSFVSSHDRFPTSSLDGFHLRHAVVAAAQGNFDEAKLVCAKLVARKTIWSDPSFSESFSRVTEELYPLLLKNDRRDVAKLLHEWEGRSMKNLKLEKIWEPTPFPLERNQ